MQPGVALPSLQRPERIRYQYRTDRHHGWALSIAERITEPLLTCEAVLAEAAFHLQDVAVVLGMLNDGLVRLAFNVDKHLDHLVALAER